MSKVITMQCFRGLSQGNSPTNYDIPTQLIAPVCIKAAIFALVFTRSGTPETSTSDEKE